MELARQLRPALGRALIALAAAGLVVLPVLGLDKKEYQVYIVLDTQFDKFLEVQEGFKASLDKQLAATGSKAVYTYLDTKLDPAQAATVVQAIKDGKPDLICMVNWPSAFADINVALKLPDPQYRIVSENCIPTQSGVAKTWKNPGGNITGVGVFVQYDSMIKAAKKVRPNLKEALFYTWDIMTALNAYFEPEITAACQREGIKLVEFKKVASSDETLEWLARMDREHPDAIVMAGIYPRVRSDGSTADLAAEKDFFQQKIKHLLRLTYDETTIRVGAPVGTCVVWYDLGAQLADQGFKVLSGAKPGDLPWEYPRKFNLMFNLAMAKAINLQIPNELLSAAYRVYTDFDGHYAGQKN